MTETNRPIYKTRKIYLPELRKLQMAHPDFTDEGWAIVELDGDEETVVDWFADHYAAVQDVAERNEEVEAN